MLKKILSILALAALVLTIAGCSTAKPEAAPFVYAHDPKLNPAAMADIVENPDAVYGFSPNPESSRLGTYAELDWTDAEAVAQYRQNRIDYHESLYSMYDILKEMRAAGSSIEEMAPPSIPCMKNTAAGKPYCKKLSVPTPVWIPAPA